MSNHYDYYIAYGTYPNREIAEKLASELVELQLAACANVLAAHTAIYSWDGRLKKESEVGVIFKTSLKMKTALAEKFRATHPYDTPALVFLPIDSGLPEFLRWIDAALTS